MMVFLFILLKFDLNFENSKKNVFKFSATQSSSTNYDAETFSTNKPNKLLNHNQNRTKHTKSNISRFKLLGKFDFLILIFYKKDNRQNQLKRKQMPYRHRQIVSTSSTSKTLYESENSSKCLKQSPLTTLLVVLLYLLFNLNV